ncbi:MAG: hypothetical protein ACP5HJ_03180 [Candidatus Micrarchaeia archaeon]
MKGIVELIPLFLFLSFLIALYLSLYTTRNEIEKGIKEATNEIKCHIVLVNLKFENLSQDEIQTLQKINKIDCSSFGLKK